MGNVVHDAVVVGSGPNGLAAAIELARSGASVLVLEGTEAIGGGTRSSELTLPGYVHDVCSAVHPMGLMSPFFRSLPLEEHGLRWIRPEASVAHPLDDEPAVMLYRSIEKTGEGLGRDAARYSKIFSPLVRQGHGLMADILSPPLAMPKHPLTFMRFGSKALWPATWFARGCFREERTRALFGGCAAHSVLPLNAPFTAALGLIFTIAGHVDEWPVAAGGSRAISDALASLLRSLGGEIQTGVRIKSVDELPPARVFLFDTGPDQLATIAEPVLPERYVRRLRRYRFGPGVFKLDWALEEPIPWRDKNCLLASTVHLGGRMAEIAAAEAALSRGEHPTRPFVLLCQQSQFDDSRAPTGKQTGYAYCHVPAGSNVDLTEAIENQVERFAPGFKDTIRARHAMHCADFERYNPNFVGGAITGGSADITQLMTRPVARLDPYTTPNRRVFLCSASTPPGGGVHGMCGYNAARSALRQLDKIAPGSLRA
jgi:phytoene dehydrogenase-like protein